MSVLEYIEMPVKGVSVFVFISAVIPITFTSALLNLGLFSTFQFLLFSRPTNAQNTHTHTHTHTHIYIYILTMLYIPYALLHVSIHLHHLQTVFYNNNIIIIIIFI